MQETPFLGGGPSKPIEIENASGNPHVTAGLPPAVEALSLLQDLQHGVASLQTHKAEFSGDFSATLHELSEEINTLQREILRTSREKPDAPCTAAQSHHILLMEKYIAKLMDKVRTGPLAVDDVELQKYGNKHANLVRMARLVEGLKIQHVHVPLPHGIKTHQVHEFLQRLSLHVEDDWQQINALFLQHDPSLGTFLDRKDVNERLETIRQKITQAFDQAKVDTKLFQALVEPDFTQWLSNIAAEQGYLMVRSTGAEDSRKATNAGGNKSFAYVDPSPAAFCEAAGNVLCSYFEFESLHNLINVGLNPFVEKPMLSVTAQQLIGETPITDTSKLTKKEDIPVSMVLFTTEPLYVQGEKFRVMRVSATYGHGEGVVGGVDIATDTVLILVSERNPDRIIVHYENADKSTRLAPVVTAEGIQLKSVKNPAELRFQRVLDDELISRLYTWGVVGENFFQGPTDMELVVKRSEIYAVQGRPINRPELVPTYLDTKKLVQEKGKNTPVIESISGQMLVPGMASVVVVNNPQEVLFATRLSDANTLYKKGIHKAVVVTRPEPANSHYIVIFSGLGMPCLYVPQGDVAGLLKRTDTSHPLAICMQEATMNLWDASKGNVDEYITPGYTVHPARIVITYPQRISGQTFGKAKPVPQEVKDLLLQVRMAETKEVASAALTRLQEHPYVGELRHLRDKLRDHIWVCIKAGGTVPARVGETYALLGYVIEGVEASFEEAQAAIRKSQAEVRLRPLFHVKALTTALLSSETGAPGEYSRLTVEPLVADAHELVSYQQQFNYPVQFAEVYLAGDAAFADESCVAWRSFLTNLEERVQEGEVPGGKAERLKGIVHKLENSSVLGIWFAFFFHADTTLDDILQMLTPEDEAKMDTILALHDSIAAMRGNLDAFSHRDTWEPAQKRLQELVLQIASPIGEQSVGALRKNASPLVKLALLTTMSEFVDVFDTAIKRMKGSTEWNDIDKCFRFKDMLNYYWATLKWWMPQMGTDLAINRPDVEMGGKSLSKFIEIIEDYVAQFDVADPPILFASKDFSVAAAAYGSEALLSRHLPQTLEDYFTFIHQSLIGVISECTGVLIDTALDKASLPASLKSTIQVIDNVNPKLQYKLRRCAFEIANNTIAVTYNISLQNHSAKMVLRYDKESGETTLQGILMGEARDRWGLTAYMTDIFAHFGVFVLAEPVLLTAQEVAICWKVRSQNDVRVIIDEFHDFCVKSMGYSIGIFGRLFLSQYGIAPHSVLDYLEPRLAHENSPNFKNDKALCLKAKELMALKNAAPPSVLKTDADVFDLQSAFVSGVDVPNAVELLVGAMFKFDTIYTHELALRLMREGKGVAQFIQLAVISLKSHNPTVRAEALDFLGKASKQGCGEKEFHHALLDAAVDPSTHVRGRALDIVASLWYELASSAPVANVDQRGSLVFEVVTKLLSVPGQHRERCRRILVSLAKPGINVKGLYEALENEADKPDCSEEIVFEIARALVANGRYISEAMALCEKQGKLIQNRIDSRKVRDLCKALIGQNHGQAMVLKLAQVMQAGKDPYLAQELYGILLEADYGFSEAMECIKGGIKCFDKGEELGNLEKGLMVRLQNNEKVTKEFFVMMKNLMQHSQPKARILALDMAGQYLHADMFTKEVLAMIKGAAIDQDAEVRQKVSTILCRTAYRKSHFPIILGLVHDALGDIANQSFVILPLSLMIEKGYGCKEGMAIVAEVIQKKESKLYGKCADLCADLLASGYAIREAKELLLLLDDPTSQEYETMLSALLNLNIGFEEMMAKTQAMLESKEKSVRIGALDLLIKVVGRGRWCPYMERVAAESFQIADPSERQKGGDIATKLFKMGVCHKAALGMIRKALTKPKDQEEYLRAFSFLYSMVNNSPEEVPEALDLALTNFHHGVDTILHFLHRGSGIDKVAASLPQDVKEYFSNEKNLEILLILVRNGRELDFAEKVLEEAVSHTDSIHDGLWPILRFLVDEGRPEAKKIAIDAIKRIDPKKVREDGILLVTSFVKKGEDVPMAFEIVKDFQQIDRNSPLAVSLCKELFAQNRFIDEAIGAFMIEGAVTTYCSLIQNLILSDDERAKKVLARAEAEILKPGKKVGEFYPKVVFEARLAKRKNVDEIMEILRRALKSDDAAVTEGAKEIINKIRNIGVIKEVVDPLFFEFLKEEKLGSRILGLHLIYAACQHDCLGMFVEDPRILKDKSRLPIIIEAMRYVWAKGNDEDKKIVMKLLADFMDGFAGYDLAEEMIKDREVMRKLDSVATFGIMMKLVANGRAYQSSQELVQATVDDPDKETGARAVLLLKQLVSKDQAIELAEQVARNQLFVEWDMELFRGLINRGYIHGAPAAAAEAILSASPSVRQCGRSLFLKLLTDGASYSEAFDAIYNAYQHPDKDIQNSARDLFMAAVANPNARLFAFRHALDKLKGNIEQAPAVLKWIDMMLGTTISYETYWKNRIRDMAVEWTASDDPAEQKAGALLVSHII